MTASGPAARCPIRYADDWTRLLILDYLDASAPGDYTCDVCIIGAGPAGIAVASAFADSRYRVCVIESGGFDSDSMTHALSEGDSVGPIDFDPSLCRLRAIGGSSRLWGGGCVPLTRLDMAPRDWVPASGWPLGFDELVAWWEQARGLLDIAPRHGIGDGGFADGRFAHALPLQPERIVDRVCYISPVKFQSRYRAMFGDSANITLVLHATLTELVAGPEGSRVRVGRIGSLAGRRGTVRARHYVLAGGAIENARLLLASDGSHPRGMGNDHDQVGRHFMDHPRCVAGKVVDGDLHALLRPYNSSELRKEFPRYRELALSDDVQREQRLLNARARPYPVTASTPAGLQALRELRASFRQPANDAGAGVETIVQRALDAGIPTAAGCAPAAGVRRGRLLLRVGMNASHVARAMTRRLRSRPLDTYRHVALMTYFEQSPNPDSRVTLADTRDALGMRRVRVDWRVAELDYASYRVAAGIFGEEAARACGGRFEPEPWVRDPALQPALVGTAHHLGTTRMSARAEDGVVDPDCRVHGMENLHVAGSSVFPTGGWAFPTFTIVALALRLSDRLRRGLEIAGA